MTTAREHMAADMAWIINQDGEGAETMQLDGVDIRAMVQELDIEPGNFDGMAIRRQALWLQKGTITLPRPGYNLTLDGALWTVESIDPTGLVDVVVMAQYN